MFTCFQIQLMGGPATMLVAVYLLQRFAKKNMADAALLSLVAVTGNLIVQLVFPNLSGQVMALLPAAWNNIIIVLVVFGLVQGAIITACALAAESALKLKKTNPQSLFKAFVLTSFLVMGAAYLLNPPCFQPHSQNKGQHFTS
jgi:hypothetical protein